MLLPQNNTNPICLVTYSKKHVRVYSCYGDLDLENIYWFECGNNYIYWHIAFALRISYADVF